MVERFKNRLAPQGTAEEKNIDIERTTGNVECADGGAMGPDTAFKKH